MARALPLSHIPPVRKKFHSQDDPRVYFRLFPLSSRPFCFSLPGRQGRQKKKWSFWCLVTPYFLLDHRTTRAGALVEGYLSNPEQKITANTQINEYEIYRLFVNSTRCCAGAAGPTSVRLKGHARLSQCKDGHFILYHPEKTAEQSHTQEDALTDRNDNRNLCLIIYLDNENI